LGGDGLALVYHYCLQKFHILPHTFNALPVWERAFICASIAVDVKRKKEEADRIEKMKRRSHVRRR